MMRYNRLDYYFFITYMAHITNTSFPYTYFQKKIVKTEDAKVSIMTNAIQYGTGVFGGMRGYYNKEKGFLSVFRMKDHFKRFLQSLRIVGVTFEFSQEDLEKITMDLIAKNKPQSDTYFRPFAYAGSPNITPNLIREEPLDFALYMIPLGDYLPTDNGVTAMVSSWRRVSDNAIPSRVKASGSYMNSALAKKEAMQHGYDDAIFLTENGHVAEGSAMNICIVRDGVLITPPKSDEILEGITRRTVLQLAEDQGVPVQERSIDRSELYVADEAFFCGTGAQVAWISQIDQRQIGTGKRGPISGKLQDLFFRVVRGNEKKYESWCTKIKM